MDQFYGNNIYEVPHRLQENSLPAPARSLRWVKMYIIPQSFRKFAKSFACNYHGTIMTTTNEAWEDEIDIMQAVLTPWREESGQIIFEYDIPRLGKRIDVVLLLRGLIFCLEFKNFHLLSRDRAIVPVLIPTKYSASSTELKPSVYDDSIYNPLVTGAYGLQNLIKELADEND